MMALLASIVVAITSWPNGLSYCNQFWGGASQSAEVFTDSNHDWGQGLPQLREWLETTGEPSIHVWYYGADPAILRPPFNWVALQHEPLPSIEALRLRVGNGYLAVADSIITGCPDRRAATLAVIDWLKSQPMTKVGNYRVYRW